MSMRRTCILAYAFRVLQNLILRIPWDTLNNSDLNGALRGVPAEGVARDRREKCATNASCAVDARIANTPHKISRSLSHFARKPARRGKLPPQKNTNNESALQVV